MARLKHSAVALACLVACGSAVADPYTIIAYAASAFGAAGAISATTAFFLATGASLLGVAAQRRQQKKAASAQKAQYNASLSDRTVTILNSEAPHQIVYGSPPPFAGAVVAEFTSGARDEFKHLIYVFAAHECEAIDDIYIDGISVGTLDGSGWASGSDFNDSAVSITTGNLVFDGSGNSVLADTEVVGVPYAYNGDNENPIEYPVTATYSSGTGDTTFHTDAVSSTTLRVSYQVRTTTPRLNIGIHLSPGGVDTADAYLMAAVPDKWTSAHKLSGYTYLRVTRDLTLPRFQGGPSRITVKARGKKVYNFATATTAYSANPIWCRADFIMSAQGWGATLAQIESASAIASGNACDVAVYTASDQTANTTVLYSCDGVFTTDQDRESTLQQLEDVCAGTTHESGGVWRLMAGYWAAPVLALTDADCHGAITIQQASYTSKERFNGLKGQYCDWRNLGVAGDFTPYSNATFLADDTVARVGDITLPFTHSHQRAVQLARVMVEKSRGGLVISFPAHMRAWPYQPGDRVTVTNTEFGWSAKNYRITDWGFGLTSPVMLELIEDESSYYDLADAVTVDAAPNTNLPDPFAKPAAPGNLTADSGTDQLLEQGDSVIPRTLLTWVQTTDVNVLVGGKLQVQWVPAGDLELNWRRQDLDSGASSTYLLGVPDGLTIFAHIRFVTALNFPGEWATVQEYVVGQTERPAAPTDFSLIASGGRGFASWALHSAADVRSGGSIVIRHSPLTTGATWEGGYILGTFPGRSVEGTVPLITGTYMAKAKDYSGNWSESFASFLATEGMVTGFTTVTTTTQDTTYTGSKTNTVATDNILKLDSTTLIDDMGAIDDVGYIDAIGGISATGTYLFDTHVDCTSVAVRRAEADLKVLAFDTDDLIDSRTSLIDEWDAIDGAEINTCDVTLYARTTNDNPAGSPTWGAWTEFMVADFNCRAFQFKAVLTSSFPTHNIQVETMRVAVKVPV